MDNECGDSLALLFELGTGLTELISSKDLQSAQLSPFEKKFVVLEKIAYYLHADGVIRSKDCMGPWGLQLFEAIVSSMNKVCAIMYQIVQRREGALDVLMILLRARQYYAIFSLIYQLIIYLTTDYILVSRPRSTLKKSSFQNQNHTKRYRTREPSP